MRAVISFEGFYVKHNVAKTSAQHHDGTGDDDSIHNNSREK
jgi:hypothetical protein